MRNSPERRPGVRAATLPPAHGRNHPRRLVGPRPRNWRSGNAARNPSMKWRTSSRPRRGACSEYWSSMSGAASSSMISGIPWISPEPLEPTADNNLVVLFARHGIDHSAVAEGISAFQQGGLYPPRSAAVISGSCALIRRFSAAVSSSPLIFGEERREQPHPWERLVPRR